jgi:Lysophospholipase catalytic domain
MGYDYKNIVLKGVGMNIMKYMCFLVLLSGRSVLSIPTDNKPRSIVQAAPDIITLAQNKVAQSDDDANEAVVANNDFLTLLTNKTVDKLKELWDSFSWVDFKQQYQKEYGLQYSGEKGIVSQGVPLTPKGYLDPGVSDEAKYLSKRLQAIKKPLEHFMGYSFDSKDELPRIGCVFSGGGYRAMIATAGFLKGLEDVGLLSTVMYISTLSGSTWCLGPWTLMQEPAKQKKVTMNEFMRLLIDKIKDKHLNPLASFSERDFDVKLFANLIAWPKIIFEQIINSVDIYGAALSHFLLSDFGAERQNQRLSNMLQCVKEGNHPWPIFTAVSMHQQKEGYLYNWYEFNPEIIMNLEHMLYFPSFAFNRKFDAGVTVDYASKQSFGFLMGIFGSAYTINLKDVKRILFGGEAETQQEQEQLMAAWYQKPISWAKSSLNKLKSIFSLAVSGKFRAIWEQSKQDLDQIKAAVVAQLINSISDTRVGSMRVAPAQIHNPFKRFAKVKQPWLRDRDYLTFVDAGIDYNLPLRPLFRPERQLDLIIVGDASGDVPISGSAELTKGLADIKRFWGVTYKQDEQVSNTVVSVYRPEQTTYPLGGEKTKHVKPPIIVYLNFLKDDALLAKEQKNSAIRSVIENNNLRAFNPNECIKTFCSTFNFEYTERQFKQLAGMAEFNIKAHVPVIKALLNERIEMRQEAVEFGS